ncbi:unnamed protein product [Caenorhabditis bovis]|uniref:Clc-like protein n=1 Tax=Caenorhabditis bovis TaxID=2654633 RepID=A0A8S1EQT4_9PELO|nr:unnamed protein product [Caenorhabditis bovis]
MIDDGSNKCGRKSALSIFFAFSLLAFLFCLLSLISPSWQYANLENGRTEHHHGLWLDCKRDYSFDYGRTREYYETLYRRDMQGSPFDVFYLPQLQCVYKFDYYIDQEDLYDHNHDENRIQNDAYQHLFLGWKIAALVGVGVGVLFSACSILLGVCSFCHRTFICACTVLLTIAAILSSLGSAIFYIWANYQDNKVIKEEDEGEIYEQSLGWAFWCHVIGTILLWICSVLGCCVTSISFSKSRAKLVKIEVIENDDGSELLSSQNFKRSFSAVYRVDSSALRQWEKSYLKNVRSRTDVETNFKRTASVPNFSKNQKKANRRSVRQSGQDFFSSNSNITEFTNFGSNATINTQQTRETAQTAPAALPIPVATPVTPKLPLKSALKTPTQTRKELPLIPNEPHYEYMPCDSTIGVSSFLGSRTPTRPNHAYDEVYETIGGGDAYLEPNSVRNNRLSNSTLSTTDMEHSKLLNKTLPPVHGSSQSIPAPKPKTTLIDDKRPMSYNEEGTSKIRFRETKTVEEREKFVKTSLLPPPPILPPKPKSIRDFGIDLSKESVGSCKVESNQENRPKFAINHSFEDSDELPPPPPDLALNTFAARQKSITNLSFRGVTPSNNTGVHQIFDRPDSIVSSVSSAEPKKVPMLPNMALHRRLLNSMPDEVDRSIGSSTILENDTRDSTTSYARDAEIRLNLFMNDQSSKNQDETTV